MEEDSCHAHGRHRREGVAIVLKHRVGKEALQAVRDAVANAKTFGYDGCEVGKLFQLLPFW